MFSGMLSYTVLMEDAFIVNRGRMLNEKSQKQEIQKTEADSSAGRDRSWIWMCCPLV